MTSSDELLYLLLADALDVPEPDAHAAVLIERALCLAGVDVGRQHFESPPLRFVDQGIGRIEPHRLLVQKRAQELRAVVDAQPGRLVGEQPKGGTMGLGKPEPREALDHCEHPLGGPLVRAMLVLGSLDEALVVGPDRRLRALAAHRPPQAFGLAGRKAGEGDRHLEHLVLEDDPPERFLQHRLQRWVLVGNLVVGILP
jgi:hypothetical protein